MIDFLNLRDAYIELRDKIDESVLSVFDSGSYILGATVEKFERSFADYCGAQHCIGVGNGLDALKIALLAHNIGVGDEVIVPAHTFIATWLAVEDIGATVIPVDVDPVSLNISPHKIICAITERTKAIIPVHLYGRPCDIEAINEIAANYDLIVIEDAAQAHGAKLHEKRIGGHGNTCCWSFYPGKNLGALGDGGAITFHTRETFEHALKLRNYGSSERYKHDVIGINSRLDPVQAAILSVKLEVLDEWNNRRSSIAELYRTKIFHPEIVLPKVEIHSIPSWHLFVVQTKKRDDLQAHLSNCGIQTLIHYPTPITKQLAFKTYDYSKFDIAISTSVNDKLLSLPIGPHLEYEKALKVIEAVNSWKCP